MPLALLQLVNEPAGNTLALMHEAPKGYQPKE